MKRMKNLLAVALAVLMALGLVLIPKAMHGATVRADANLDGAAANAPEQDAEEGFIYGFTTIDYSAAGAQEYAKQWTKFDPSEPGSVTDLGGFTVTEGGQQVTADVSAAAFANGKVYGYLFGETGYEEYDGRFFSIDFADIEAGNLDKVEYPGYDIDDLRANSMAYDCTTGVMYMYVLGDYGENELYSVDLESGEPEFVCEFGKGSFPADFEYPCIERLTFDKDGNCYALVSDYMSDPMSCGLCRIDMSSLQVSLVEGCMFEGKLPNAVFSDHATGKMYVELMDANTWSDNKLYEVDMASGNLKELGSIGGEQQRLVIGLFTPHDCGDPQHTQPPIVTPTPTPTQDPGTPKPTNPPITSPTTIYGYAVEELYGDNSYAGVFSWSSFADTEPGKVTDFGTITDPDGNDTAVVVEEFVNGRIYGYTGFGYTQYYFSIGFEDMVDGNFDAVQFTGEKLSGNEYYPLDMAYDHSTGTMYMLSIYMPSGGKVVDLYKIDMVTGEPTCIGSIWTEDIEDEEFYGPLSLAIATDGTAYCLLPALSVGMNGGTAKLCTIDLETCEAKIVSDLGRRAGQEQSMCYDHNSGYIYWAEWNSMYDWPCYLYRIDPKNGYMDNLGVIGTREGLNVLGMFIPYYTGDDPIIPTTPTPPPEIPAPPAGYAAIALRADDFWGDGSGYQMLIDANHNTFGGMFNPGSPLCSGNAPAGVYEEFEYKIPENADGNLNTQNIVCGGREYIFVPAGTYDWVIVNPAPSENTIYVAANGNIDGGADDFTFEAGKTYEFYAHAGDGHDRVDLTVDGEDYVPGTEPPVTEEPATEPPVTEAPVTDEPATEPPVTEAPAAEPPVTDEPATEPPVTDEPATEPPVTDEPATEPPATDEPATEPPATEAPATEPTETPSNPPAPPTGAVSLIGLGAAAMLTGSGIVVFRRKRD